MYDNQARPPGLSRLCSLGHSIRFNFLSYVFFNHVSDDLYLLGLTFNRQMLFEASRFLTGHFWGSDLLNRSAAECSLDRFTRPGPHASTELEFDLEVRPSLTRSGLKQYDPLKSWASRPVLWQLRVLGEHLWQAGYCGTFNRGVQSWAHTWHMLAYTHTHVT